MSTLPYESQAADMAPHLLVIDDDSRIRELLGKYLGEHGFRVTTAANAADARHRLGGLTFDLLIVDVMMPGESGMELTKSLRETMTRPDPDADRPRRGRQPHPGARVRRRRLSVQALRAARAAAQDQQHPQARRRSSATPLIEVVRFGPFTFHRERLELKRGAEPVHLTDRERQIMAIFAATPGETVPRTDLIGNDGPSGERTVDVQINRLRRKIEADPANPIYLQTVRGLGYRLTITA